jgi:hypothetical protein
MPRRSPTADERKLHRVRISIDDLIQATRFIDAAVAAEAAGAEPMKDVVHQALVCAPVIYYARPFSTNEHPNVKKRPAGAADPTVDIGALKNVISTAAGRRLHRSILRWRHKIVAHAESRYFKVKMTRAHPRSFPIPYSFLSVRVIPVVDLWAMRANAVNLCKAYVVESDALGSRVRPGKRLRRFPEL